MEGFRHEIDGYKLQSLSILHTPRTGRVLAIWLVGIFCLFVLALFMPWQQNIRGEGTVTTINPEDRPHTINASIPGRIQSWSIREGQYVKKGDTILTMEEVKTDYFDPNQLVRIREQLTAKRRSLMANQKKMESYQKVLRNTEQARSRALEKARNKVIQARYQVTSDSANLAAQKELFQVAQRQFNRYDTLYQKGLVSKTEWEKRRNKLQTSTAKLTETENKYQTSQRKLAYAKINLSSVRAEYDAKVSKAESDLAAAESYLASVEGEFSKLQNYYDNIVIRQQQRVVVAPQNGFLVQVKKQGIGEMVKAGSTIATIMPADPEMAAALYVKANDVPLLRKGDKVRLEFDGWPALQFGGGWPTVAVGTFGGEVQVIDYIDTKGKYRVLVRPDPDGIEWPKLLRQGSGVYGWIMLQEVPVWYEIWRRLNGFPPNMQPKKEPKGSYKKGPKLKIK